MTNAEREMRLLFLLQDAETLHALLSSVLSVCRSQEDNLRSMDEQILADQWLTARCYIANVQKYITI